MVTSGLYYILCKTPLHSPVCHCFVDYISSKSPAFLVSSLMNSDQQCCSYRLGKLYVLDEVEILAFESHRSMMCLEPLLRRTHNHTDKTMRLKGHDPEHPYSLLHASGMLGTVGLCDNASAGLQALTCRFENDKSSLLQYTDPPL